MKNLHAEKITPEGAADVHVLLTSCGRDLSARHGLHNWDPPASIHLIKRDALEREVYLFRKGTEAIATITLGISASIPYGEALRWSPDISIAVYVNRLAVHPALQGLGYGRFCMGFAEDRALSLEARAIRCDVLAANALLRNFYEGIGYRVMGERAHSGWHFACYEKVLQEGTVTDR